MGYYDLARIIDYVLNETCTSNIHYIAHSQGTTSFLVLMSTRPEYNQKIVQAHLMAPPAFRKKLPKSLFVFFGLKFLVIKLIFGTYNIFTADTVLTLTLFFSFLFSRTNSTRSSF
jgi:pimeloyl-ACP methyl ester carboxylesterase